MRSNLRRGTALVLWVILAAIVVAAAVGAILVIGKTLGASPASLSKNTVQGTPTIQSVSDSDETVDIQKELQSTNFDDIDRDLGDTSRDLSAL